MIEFQQLNRIENKNKLLIRRIILPNYLIFGKLIYIYNYFFKFGNISLSHL